MDSITLSAVVLAKNEEKNLARRLISLNFCDEIIVIDDSSTDKTVEIAKSAKATVYSRNLDGDFAGQRNFGLEKSRGEWILFVDADEEISQELQKDCFYLKRRDWFWGRELRHGETKKVRNKGLIRLVKKGSGKWFGKVHEEYKIKNQKPKIKNLVNYLDHYPHQTVKDFLNEINFYSTLRAKELFNNNKKTNIFEITLFPLGKFIYNYFICFGFLDGAPGFAYAFFMSLHSFLVRTKLYQYTRIDTKR